LHIPRVGGVNRFFVVVHFIGDPIDSMWSLLTKAEVWDRFYRIAFQGTPPGPEREPMARALSAMLSAFEELTGDMSTVQRELNDVMSESGTRLSSEDLDYILMETADELVDSRSNEVLRTVLVIVNYLWAVLGALVPQIGGAQTSQPGGRIGTAMFLSWLVTAVLLSNTLSGFTSRRTCLRIMERYYRTLRGQKRDAHFFPNSPRLVSLSSWVFSKKKATTATTAISTDDDFIDSQPWNGSVYSYRPHKRLIPSGLAHDWSPAHLLLLSAAPIIIAAVSAFVIIWFTPTIGLGCRTLWVIGLSIGLILSPILTWGISKMATGKFAWYITIANDAFIGIPALTTIILSSIGIFNTCWCWSGVYSRGRAKAFIDLDPADERAYNLHHIYPAMVAACLALQLATYLLMYRIMRLGGRVFRPDEDDKMAVYRRIHGLGSPSLPPGDNDLGMEMSVSAHSTPLGRDRNHGQCNLESDAAELLLPAPAISPHPSPRLSSQVHLEQQRPRSLSRTSDGNLGGTPVLLAGQGSEFEYGSSPEWRAPDQPLLGSPAMNKGW
ncbi:hypothetical protein B0J13DRAFT_442017, partial [Dactylonectria estremocensis]